MLSIRLPSALLLVSLLVALTLTLSARSAGAISGHTVFAPTGALIGDQFGYAVASAGDFDADGHPDVMVGAPFNDAGGVTAGRVYLYRQSSPLLFTGIADDQMGYSVASAGDFNGDGFDDLIIGAPGFGGNVGRAFIYLGGPSPNTVADLTLTTGAATEFFGGSVAGAGDVNGDGFDDVIVGARGNDVVAVDAGRAYVFYGGAVLNNVVDITLSGAVAGDQFGYRVSGAGDFNGDGFDDVIVAALSGNAVVVDGGNAFVFYGGLVANSTADLTLNGEAASDQFGISVASAGDVNGDGYPDVIVGANGNDAGGPAAGRAYVYYGGPNADATSDLTLTGTAGDELGWSVASAADVNGDGFADLIASAVDGGANSDGLAYVYLGGTSPNSTADLTVAAAPEGAELGWAVASAGDVDADGYSDIIVGDPGDGSIAVTAGKAYLISVFPYQILSPNGGETWVAGAPATVRWRGHDVADLAISTDGGLTYSTSFNSIGGADENEFTLTAPNTPTGQAKVRLTFRGQLATNGTSDVSDHVFRIVAPLPPPPAAERLQLTPTGGAMGAFLGWSVASAGDMNGDGYSDIIVGAPSTNASTGAAHVYFGGPSADATADLTLNGEAGGDNFGFAVAGAGDVNGDGFDDVIAGAFLHDEAFTDQGRAYVFFGGNVPNAVADLTLTDPGGLTGDQFGNAVASAGDFNGDGFDDVIVGALLSNPGAVVDAGSAYLYYGGPTPNLVVDLAFNGAAAADQFGTSVGSGDVNGDGFSDVVIGAPFVDIGTTFIVSNVGRAYVFYGGGVVPDNLADVVLGLTEPAAGDFFGESVATGDVDGDGFDDVIVGADFRDDVAPDAGAAYVFSGGPGFDGLPKLTLVGAAGSDRFGISVGAAGDINGDGFEDVIVGASLNDAGGATAGRAYVFYGEPFRAPGGAEADHILTGAAAGDEFGASVASAGDINGDGFDDVVVGGRLNDAGGLSAGRGYVYDFNRYHLLTPNGGETWNVGGTQDISWLGAEPADVWLSVDAGRSFDRLRTGVGGLESNTISIQVPHAPTKFALVKVTPTDASLRGQDVSAARFTIQASVGLLSLAAKLTDEGAEISWGTQPGVGPDGLAGYRLYRAAPGSAGSGTRVGSDLITDTHFVDREGAPGTTYRLSAVNGLLQELELGRVMAGAAIAGLQAWPSPLRSGTPLNVAFAAPFAGSGYLATDLDVGLFDIHGRRVATLARGAATPRTGVVSLTWSAVGNRLESGVYFVRATAPSAGFEAERKVVVMQ